MKQERGIFLYDGECGFCNSTVIFLLDNTAADRLAFCALQSDYAHALCREHGVEHVDLSTAYFFDGAKIHMRSSAVLRAISLCNTPASFLAVGFFIPKFIRDYLLFRDFAFPKTYSKIREEWLQIINCR